MIMFNDIRAWLIRKLAGDWGVLLNVDVRRASVDSACLESDGKLLLVSRCHFDCRYVRIQTNGGKLYESLESKLGLATDHLIAKYISRTESGPAMFNNPNQGKRPS